MRITANKTNGTTRTCGLIGNPVEHTQSPLIHNTLAALTGENLVYVPLRVEPERLGDAVRGAYALNLLGCNVTVPYKTDVIPYLTELDPLAERIGAVNTLVRCEDQGGYKGYNTDMPGLYRAMCADGVRIEGEHVLILGAGGVARAVAVLLAEKGAASVTILNRTVSHAQAVADEVNEMAKQTLVQALPLADYERLSTDRTYLCIQATNVGMYPNTDDVVIDDPRFYERLHTGYDLIFNPDQTRFMQLVRAAGGRAFNGARMLLYQGVIAYELWTGKAVSDEQAQLVATRMRAAAGAGRNILLTGFMGSGKTSVGLKLSWRLRMPVEDTDKVLERRAGCTVSEIFEQQGEAAFRRMETELLREIAAQSGRKIWSLGGGTPVDPANRELMRACGTVVYLRIRPETVYERLQGDTTRPLLQCADPLERIRTLMDERREAYESGADVIVDVDELTTDEILDKIEAVTGRGEA